MTANGRVVSIQIGRPRRYPAVGDAEPWTSAITKSPVDGPVRVTGAGLAGDAQADLDHHGGPDKAVLAYPLRHYDDWSLDVPDVSIPVGGFGENLVLADVDESATCIGDTYRVGECLFEVSQPRQPCWKLSRRWGVPRLHVRVRETGRTGWYLRVLEEGAITNASLVELVARPNPEFTIARANEATYARGSSSMVRTLVLCDALSEAWRSTLERREGDPEHRPSDE